MKKLLSLLFLIGSLGIGAGFAIELNSSNILVYCPTNNSVCNLSGKNITSIAPNTFRAYSNLHELYLRDNALTGISRGVFDGLSNLTLLSLSRNQITNIETGSFASLNKLTDLYLYSNPISIFEAGVFSGLTSLQQLYLYSGMVTKITTGVLSDLPNLSFLDLHGNTISTINDLNFSGLNSLRSLDLGYNQLIGVDNQNIASLTQLMTINLDNNKITNVNGSDFSGLSNLESIGLVNNKINRIPTGFSLLPKLNGLFLSNNLITGLYKEDFVELTGLITLVLDDNQIQYIESGALLPLKNLQGIWLNDNPITGITVGTFNGLENLYDIYLGGNSISRIEDGSFLSLKNLSILDLYRVSGGCVDNITSKTFEGPTKIRHLSFCTSNLEIGALSGRLLNGANLFIHSRNGLNISSGAFAGTNPSVMSLDFYYCSNCGVAEGAFNGISNLQELYIAGSANIGNGVITPNLFNNLSNLRILSVQGNFTGISLGSFSNLDNIKQLSLIGQIENIESQTFQGLNNLEELDLHTNNISSIKSGAFSQMPLLTAINLGWNQIKEIELGAFFGIQKKLAVLVLNNNNISLDPSLVSYLNLVADTIFSDPQQSYITYTPSESTSGPVVATVHLINGDLITNNGAKNTYTFTKNGTFDFKIEQANGYRGYHRATVTWITPNPLQTTPTISYSNTLPTSGDVTATISFSNGGTITNNSGSNTKLFTSNGTFTFDFADLAGHTGSAVASVSNIDKTKPTSTVSYVTNENGSVTATLTLSETGTISNTAGVITVTPGFIFSHTFTEIGSFTFNFADLVGNTGTRTVTINSMSSTPGDTTPPTGIISYTTNPNGSVTATITLSEVGNIVNNGGSNQYTFTSNGSFIFQFNDLAGNTGYATANVTSITTNNNGENTNSTDTTPPTCLVSNTSTFSGSYLHLEWGCSDDLQLSGLSLTINDENNNLIYSTGLSVSSTDFKYYTDSGIYKRKIIASDKAGNKSTMNYKTINYQKLTAINISPSGYFYDDIYYISGYRAILSITGNTRFGFKIVGDVSNTIVGSYTTGVLNQTIIFDQGEGFKTVLMNYITSNQSDSGATDPITFYVDTTSPSIIPIYPLDLSNSTGSSMNFEWSATDTGVGISGYVLEITRSTRKPTLVYLGATSTNYTLTKMSNGTYSWKLKAIDYAGNTKETASSTFTIGTTLPTGDISPDSFSLDKEYDADLNEEYESEIVTVSGLSTGTKVLAYVSNGSLIINGDDVGTSGYVQNKDKVQIAMYSSKKYDTLSSGTLTIGDQFSNFKIVTRTKDDDSGMYTVTSLSNSEKLNISLVYNALLGIYDEDEQDDFMLSFKYIVKDKIDKMIDNDEDETKIEKMKYLYNIINKNFKGEEDSTIIDATEDTTSSNNDETIKYTAPNNKEYTITHDSKGYTSSTFLKSGKYFNSLSEIKTYINKNNPKSPYHMIDFTIDTTWNQSYTAPNGKKYVLFKTTDGRYGSNSFIYGKTFTSLNAIQTYINQNNQY